MGTGPGIVLGALDDGGADGIGLDVADNYFFAVGGDGQEKNRFCQRWPVRLRLAFQYWA